MLQFVIGALIFILIAIAIIVLVIINFTYKGIRQLRKTAEDQFELNQKRKEQKERNPFGDDYFKSSDIPRNQQNQQKSQQKTEKNTARRTTTSSGVTIIDEREPDKKIFSHDDGEYVEFEEVGN